MPPTQEKIHRQNKRTKEMTLILETLSKVLPAAAGRRVLEFGAGAGFQIPFLRELGHVSALDVALEPSLKTMQGIDVFECSIAQTPFSNGSFDLIFSNHVIEHLEDPPAAFEELKRIGKPDCIYAFSVPTNIWLLLSVPAQYWSRLKRALGNKMPIPASHSEPAEDFKMGEESQSQSSEILRPPLKFQRTQDDKKGEGPVTASASNAETAQAPADPGTVPASSRDCPFWSKLLPRGHGVEENFVRCYEQFKISRWKDFFSAQGFVIRETKPLLLYGPSEFPVIPTLPAAAAAGLCSSVLFILNKK